MSSPNFLKAENDPAQPVDIKPVQGVDATSANTDTTTNKKGRLRNTLFAIGIAVFAIAGLAFYLLSGRYVDTDNAYVKANKVTISAQVAGPIKAIAVRENQRVNAGDELFRIDDQPYRIALQRADAQLRTVQAELDALKASYRQMSEQLRMARSNTAFATREFERQQQLVQQKLTPRAKFDEAQHTLENSRQQAAMIEQQQAQILSQLDGDANIVATRHSRYREAQASRDAAELDLQHSIVHAPFAGITSKVPQVGQYVSAGNAVMSVVATSELWIEANFMETDLTHVREGQSVKVRIDTYPDRTWEGTVQSISQATGAEFSVLPPQNASGNWVKVVQRIPVRIAIAPQSDDPPLRVGMTAFVKIDTGRHHTLSGAAPEVAARP